MVRASHAQAPTRGKTVPTRHERGARVGRGQKDSVRRRGTVRALPDGSRKRVTGTSSTTELIPLMRRGRGSARRRWYFTGALVAALGIVALAIAGLFATANGAADTSDDTTLSIGSVAPSAVMDPVTRVSPRTFASVGDGGLPNPIRALSPSQAAPLETRDGKPEILYIDTEYCPYCAAERWSMIVALSRFGAFSSLHLTESTPYDVAPDTRTFAFHGSHYSSPYIDFAAVEFQDRDGKPLDAFTVDERQIFEMYDAPPYVPANLTRAIPFISFANEYYAVNGGYDPQVLGGLSWLDIATALNSPTDPVAQNVVGNANYITAAICQVTQNAPDRVCGAAPIRQIEQRLPQRT